MQAVQRPLSAALRRSASVETLKQRSAINARAFASFWDHRRVQHIFTRQQRWPPSTQLPTDQLKGPGEYAGPATGERATGRSAAIKPRWRETPKTTGGAPVGPGRYDPALSGTLRHFGAYDETIPSALTRAPRGCGGAASAYSSPGFEGHPGLPPRPAAPGSRGLSWGVSGATTAEGDGRPEPFIPSCPPAALGPGAYHPSAPSLHRPSAVVRGRPFAMRATSEGVGPGSHNLPERPRTTAPAGGSFPAFSFAATPYMPRGRPQERAAALAKSRSHAELVAHSLSPAGRAEAAALRAERARLDEERAVRAAERRAGEAAAHEQRRRELEASFARREQRQAALLRDQAELRKQAVRAAAVGAASGASPPSPGRQCAQRAAAAAADSAAEHQHVESQPQQQTNNESLAQ